MNYEWYIFNGYNIYQNKTLLVEYPIEIKRKYTKNTAAKYFSPFYEIEKGIFAYDLYDADYEPLETMSTNNLPYELLVKIDINIKI